MKLVHHQALAAILQSADATLCEALAEIKAEKARADRAEARCVALEAELAALRTKTTTDGTSA